MDNSFSKRTVEFVLNKDDGLTVYANLFFLKEENEVFNYRSELQKVIKGIREPLFVCYFCGQNIKINGGGKTKKVLHFAHKKDSDFCHLKTDTNYSQLEILRVKFNGAKESPLHFETKNLIKQFIESNSDFSNIRVEKVVKSNSNYLEWKKPDISATYKNLKVVFEIQLSTTFLSVIVDREHFYRENRTYILWIFKNFEVDEFKQRFTEKDVFYSNNRNAFVIDNEAINLSQQNNDLYLLCYYQKPVIENLKINYNWEFEYVCFNHLTFDEENYKIFYFDVNKEEERLNEEIFAIEKELREKEYANQHRAKEEVSKHTKERVKDIYYEDDNYSYYEDEIEEPELTTTQKLIRDRNVVFDKNNRSILIELESKSLITEYQQLFLKQQNEMYDKILMFFQKDYILSIEDKKFIKKIFDKNITENEISNNNSIIYYVSISLFLNKLSKNKDLYRIYDKKVEQLLFTILSIKIKKVIGNNFSNLIQFVNYYTNLKNDRVVFFDVIVKAIEVYYGIDDFCKKEDKKGLLKPKILNVNNWKPQQDPKYNEIVSIVFPDIIFKNEEK